MLKILVVMIMLTPGLSYSKMACSLIFELENVATPPSTVSIQTQLQVHELFKDALPRIHKTTLGSAVRMGGRSRHSLFNDFAVINFMKIKKIKSRADAKLDISIETIASPSLQLKSSVIIEGIGISREQLIELGANTITESNGTVRATINLDKHTLSQIQSMLVDLTLTTIHL